MPSNKKLFALCFLVSLAELSWGQRIVEEVVITARKIDETIIDIPVSVSAITGEKISNFGITDVSGIAKQTPNITFAGENGARNGGPVITIRGIGTNASLVGFEQSVGMGFDGIFVSDSLWMLTSVFDIQQVEVLRGPQGTFFGKNTTAGMLNFKTRGPREEFEANINVSYTPKFSGKTIEAGIGGPLTDYFGARIALRKSDSEGFVNNINFGGVRGPENKDLMGRLTLEFTPNDSIGITIKSLAADKETEGSPFELGGCNDGGRIAFALFGDDCVLDDITTGGSLDAPGQQIAFLTNNRELTFTDLQASYQVINVDWDISDSARLQLITGYSDLDNVFAADGDHVAAGLVALMQAVEQKIFSQEVRLDVALTDNVDLTAGIYYDQSDSEYLATGDFAIAAFEAVNVVDGDSLAFFFQTAIQLTDTVELSLGGRQTEANKDVLNRSTYNPFGRPTALGPNIPEGPAFLVFQTGSREGERTDKHFTPSVVLSWSFLEDFDIPFLDDGKLYASYKEGFKAGGFDTVSKQDTNFFEFEDEYVKGFELGGKLEMLDGRLRTNFALFHSSYDDLQVQTLVPILEVITINAASATTKGIEIDGQFTASEALSFNFAAAWTIAEYDNFSLAPCNRAQLIGELTGCELVLGPSAEFDPTQDSPGLALGLFQDLSGEPLVGAPELTTSVGFDYSIPVGDNGAYWSLGTQVAFRDESNTAVDNDPNIKREAHWDVSAYTAVTFFDGRLDFSLIGKNLLDERVVSIAADYTPFLALPGSVDIRSYEISRNQPRSFTLQTKYRF